MNGDGLDDIIIGARSADPNGTDSGESYVVFGTTTGFGPSLDLSTLNGSDGFILNGIDEFDYSGSAVSSAGDINGDGISDIVIGARSANPNDKVDAGETYVIFGSTNLGSSGVLELSDLDGSDGFVINGVDAQDNSGRSVSGVGDINGDGVDDLLISAELGDPNGLTDAGESYVIFGWTPLNVVDGTSGNDVLIGTPNSDRITGSFGLDLLFGGRSGDVFVYETLADRLDVIGDFTAGEDLIDLSQLLDRIGYLGSDPIGDGIVDINSYGLSSRVVIDRDGPGPFPRRTLVRVIGTDVASLNDPANFVF